MGLRFVHSDKPKPQFSKLHVVFADILVFIVWVSYIVLAWFEKPFIPDVALGIITIYGGFATGGYFIQNCVRDTSLNKVERCRISNGFTEGADS